MDGAALWTLLAEHGIHLEQFADKTGYSLAYTVQILTRATPFTDSAKFKAAKAFPKLAKVLMEKEAP